jgi:hypothetical protein
MGTIYGGFSVDAMLWMTFFPDWQRIASSLSKRS